MSHQFLKIIVVLFLALLPVENVSAQLDFEFNIDTNIIDTETDMSIGNISAADATALNAALMDSADFWGQFITGFQPEVTGLTGITLDIGLSNFATPTPPDGDFVPSGPGGVLASAGPSGFVDTRGDFTFLTDGDSRLTGNVTIDVADFLDVDSQLFIDTLNHEIGHAIGFGTLWDRNNLAVDGSGQYTGEAGLAAYRAEFDPDAEFIPIELDGGEGTANGHFNEVLDFGPSEDFEGFDVAGNPIFDPDGEDDPGDIVGSAPTVLLDGPTFGNSLDDDLLTGRLTVFLPSGNTSTFLSNTTVATFEDLGFTVALPNPVSVVVPEPSSFVVVATLGCLGLLRRRRSRKDEWV